MHPLINSLLRRRIPRRQTNSMTLTGFNQFVPARNRTTSKLLASWPATRTAKTRLMSPLINSFLRLPNWLHLAVVGSSSSATQELCKTEKRKRIEKRRAGLDPHAPLPGPPLPTHSSTISVPHWPLAVSLGLSTTTFADSLHRYDKHHTAHTPCHHSSPFRPCSFLATRTPRTSERGGACDGPHGRMGTHIGLKTRPGCRRHVATTTLPAWEIQAPACLWHGRPKSVQLGTLPDADRMHLRAFLHRVKVPELENPTCLCGMGPQTVEHLFTTECTHRKSTPVAAILRLGVSLAAGRRRAWLSRIMWVDTVTRGGCSG